MSVELLDLHGASKKLATTRALWQRRRVCASLERQEAIDEAPSVARGVQQGYTERTRFPLRA